jgi:hypothetical protein
VSLLRPSSYGCCILQRYRTLFKVTRCTFGTHQRSREQHFVDDILLRHDKATPLGAVWRIPHAPPYGCALVQELVMNKKSVTAQDAAEQLIKEELRS